MWALPSASEWCLAALLLAGAVPASATAQEDELPSSSYSHRMAQGRFFLQAGQARQALVEFEAAALLPEGQAASEVHQLIAKTRYSLGDIGPAVEAARTAAALTARLPPEFAEFYDFITSRFGKVLVVGGSAPGAVRPEPATPLLDPELKRAFVAARQRLDGMADGSTSVYLPVGSYRVGGHIVEVLAKGVTRMDLRPTVGATGTGVYGERRSEERTRSKRLAPKPRKAPRSAPPPEGALLIEGGAAGYGQQGSGSAGARLTVGAELGVLRGALVFDAAALVGVGRAERLLGATAPPAGHAGTRLGVSLALPVGSAVRVGPSLGWHLAGSGLPSAVLPTGYPGPTSYLLLGAELGARIAWGGDRGATPVLSVLAFVRESQPQGAVGADARPHLTGGGIVDLGVRIR